MEIHAAVHVADADELVAPSLGKVAEIVKERIAQQIAFANQKPAGYYYQQVTAAVRVLGETNDRPDQPEEPDVLAAVSLLRQAQRKGEDSKLVGEALAALGATP